MIVSLSINLILYFKGNLLIVAYTVLIVRISASWSDRPFIIGHIKDKFILLLSTNILSMAVLLPIFHFDCTRWWRLCYSLILVTKVNVVERVTTSALWLYHQHNQSTHLTVGMTLTSLSASLQHETSVARDWLCQITINWKNILYCLYQIV